VPIAPTAPNPSLPSGLLADLGDAPTTTTATATAADGFAAVLAAAQGAPRLDPSTLPTVSLDQMVAAVAGSPLTASVGLLAPDAATAAASVAASSGVGAATATDAPRAAGGVAAATSGQGQRILAAGERYLGVPYKWGGTSARTGFDCSGFTQQVFADLGVRLPRVSVDQSKVGAVVPDLASAQPGDLLFFGSPGNGRPNHIGIYAGDGKMLHAPRTGDVVRYQDLNRTPASIRRITV
jgi:cell wall-associated NlpC family hydrolase